VTALQPDPDDPSAGPHGALFLLGGVSAMGGVTSYDLLLTALAPPPLLTLPPHVLTVPCQTDYKGATEWPGRDKTVVSDVDAVESRVNEYPWAPWSVASGGGDVWNDVWRAGPPVWQEYADVANQSQHGDPLPRIVSKTRWSLLTPDAAAGRRQLSSLRGDGVPPPSMDYREWLCCIPAAAEGGSRGWWPCTSVRNAAGGAMGWEEVCRNSTGAVTAQLASRYWPRDGGRSGDLGTRRWSPRTGHAAAAVRNATSGRQVLVVMGGQGRDFSPLPSHHRRGGLLDASIAGDGPAQMGWQPDAVTVRTLRWVNGTVVDAFNTTVYGAALLPGIMTEPTVDASNGSSSIQNGNATIPADRVGSLWVYGNGTSVPIDLTLADVTLRRVLPHVQRYNDVVQLHRQDTLLSDVWASSDGGSTWRMMNGGCYVPQATHAQPPGRRQHTCATDSDCWGKRLGNARCASGKCVCRHWTPRRDFAVATNASALYLAGGIAHLPASKCGRHWCGDDHAVVLNDVWLSSDVGATWQLLTPAAPWRPRALFGMAFVPAASTNALSTAPVPPWYATADAIWLGRPRAARPRLAGNSPADTTADNVTSAASSAGLWVIGGLSWDTRDVYGASALNDVWHSDDDGVNWSQNATQSPWQPRFGHSVVVAQPASGIVEGTLPQLVIAGGFVAVPTPPPPTMPSPANAVDLAMRATVSNIRRPRREAAPPPLPGETLLSARFVTARDTWAWTIGEVWLPVPPAPIVNLTAWNNTSSWNGTSGWYANATNITAPSRPPAGSLAWRQDYDHGVNTSGWSYLHPSMALAHSAFVGLLTSTPSAAGMAGVVDWARAVTNVSLLSNATSVRDAAGLSPAVIRSLRLRVPLVCRVWRVARAVMERCRVQRHGYEGEFMRGLRMVDTSTRDKPPSPPDDGGCEPWQPPQLDVVCRQGWQPRLTHAAAVALSGIPFLVAGYEERGIAAGDAWYRDESPPVSLITSAPRDQTNDNFFAFAADEPGCRFEYK